MTPLNPASVWEELERQGKNQKQPGERLLRALGASAIGIRAGYLPWSDTLELLIEVPATWSGDEVIPGWRGMGYEIIALPLPPRKDALHLRLFLVNREHREIFIMVCEDLVAALEGIRKPSKRVKEIEACLLRWRRFFERSGPDGLGLEMQQGLFAELTWLCRLLEAGINPSEAITSWKGCERGYHDFDLEGDVVEVKSTRTKEPMSVTIGNERQLDDDGLLSLHLYALSVQVADGGGQTLRERVEELLVSLEGFPAASELLRRKLVSAGYLARHADLYKKSFVIKRESLYQVTEGFPRIIVLPPGVGDLRYRILLSACEAFRIRMENYLSKLKGSKK